MKGKARRDAVLYCDSCPSSVPLMDEKLQARHRSMHRALGVECVFSLRREPPPRPKRQGGSSDASSSMFEDRGLRDSG